MMSIIFYLELLCFLLGIIILILTLFIPNRILSKYFTPILIILGIIAVLIGIDVYLSGNNNWWGCIAIGILCIYISQIDGIIKLIKNLK